MRDTEKIIQELYVLDPSLRELGGDVRVLVETLLSAQPTVTANQAFLDNLRRSLITRADSRHTEPTYTSISWWMVRLVPLGAVAILVLTLLPTRQFSPIDLASPERGGGPDMPAATAPDASFEAESVPSMMIADEASVPAPVILPAVTVDVPSFIVVHVSVNGVLGEIVGVSDLLPAGRTEGVRINLIRDISPSESLRGVFYTDDGDSVFSELDLVKENPETGAPLYIPLN